jgi:RimJ/RimL family protein N-acetyltransferase
MSASGRITLRPAGPDDCDQLWRWVNDPVVRASSFSGDSIKLDAHQRWFAARLDDPRSLIFIAEDEAGSPVGQIRFDLAGDAAEIDVTVDPSQRGRGIGAVLIARGVAALFERHDVAVVRARVKQSNVASIAAFRRAGFEPASETLVNDCPATVFTTGPKNRRP